MDMYDLNGGIHRRWRYDFFTIWGNGLAFLQEILDLLRAEPNLDLIRIDSQQVKNMGEFIFDLYACDTVPVEHLRAKLAYLFRVRPDVVFVFVKNLSPEEMLVGQGAFRKVQCQYINRIKWDLREKYNPRVNGQRTEEHVIHASDYEEQVDYLLKLLGHREGIQFLEGDGGGLPFHKPYHIARPKAYVFRTTRIAALQASILQRCSSEGVSIELRPITETPHFLALLGNPQCYIDYLERFRYRFLKDNYSWKRLMALSRLADDELKSFDPILVRLRKGSFVILDGVHRAAVALYRGFETIRCIEMIY